MIDLSQYRQASFRGIPFHVASSSLRLSHRIDKKSYPFGKRGLVTDMGVNDDEFQEAIFLLGDDVLQRRKALEDAFRVIGPGKYVHPTRGTLDVVVETVDGDEKLTELGVADFTVTFVQSGDAIGPIARVDTQANLLTAADVAQEDVINGYDLVLIGDEQVEQSIDYEKLATAAIDLYRMSQTITPGAIKGAAISMGTDFAIELAGAAGPGLLTEAFSVAETIGSSFGATPEGVQSFIGTLTEHTGTAWRVAQNSGVLDSYAMMPVISKLSNRFMATNYAPSASETTNRGLMGQAIFDAVSVTAARSVANTPFESIQQAIGVRDTLVSALTTAANATTTTDPKRASARNQSLRNLRTAVSRDLSERSAELPWLEQETPAATAPSRVTAYRLTGRIDGGLTARNTITHPSFVKAGETVLYLKERSNG